MSEENHSMSKPETEVNEVTFPLPHSVIRRLIQISNQESNHSASVNAIKVLVKEGVDVDAFLAMEEAGDSETADETAVPVLPVMDASYFKKLAGV